MNVPLKDLHFSNNPQKPENSDTRTYKDPSTGFTITKADDSVIFLNENLYFYYQMDIDSFEYLEEEQVLLIYSIKYSTGNSGRNFNWSSTTGFTTLIWLDKRKYLTFESFFGSESETYYVLEELEDEPDDTYLGKTESLFYELKCSIKDGVLTINGNLESDCDSQVYSKEEDNYIKSNNSCSANLNRSFILSEQGIIEK